MDIGVALWFGMVSDGYVCDMGVGFGLVMLPMDFSVFPMMEKDSWKVETDMRSVEWSKMVVCSDLYYKKWNYECL